MKIYLLSILVGASIGATAVVDANPLNNQLDDSISRDYSSSDKRVLSEQWEEKLDSSGEQQQMDIRPPDATIDIAAGAIKPKGRRATTAAKGDVTAETIRHSGRRGTTTKHIGKRRMKQRRGKAKASKAKASKAKASKAKASKKNKGKNELTKKHELTKKQWKELDSAVTELVDASPLGFLDHCSEEFNITANQQSAWQLIVSNRTPQTSSLCVMNFFCAFADCNPDPMAADKDESVRLENYQQARLATSESPHPLDSLPDDILRWINDTSNPSYNMPMKALFPRNADEVVTAVEFANKYGLKISIKNSGHSYSGASTRAGTLLLNMRKYEAYAATSIISCDRGDASFIQDQPCRLATARGKSGYIRVSGGENWGETFEAVHEYNKAFGWKYHAVGGQASTVSPFGWSMLAGLSGPTGGRLFGFGADQILQIEMVLASGDHVLFGPVDWDEAEGKVPQTKEVGGSCRVDGEWTECREDIPFKDLWKVVRGGGGGKLKRGGRIAIVSIILTCLGFGVILSFSIQLHPYHQLEHVSIGSYRSYRDIPGLPNDTCSPMANPLRVFSYLYYLNPSYFETANDLIEDDANKFDPVTAEDSNACSNVPSGIDVPFKFACQGEGAGQKLLNTFVVFLTNWNILFGDQFDFFIGEDQLEDLKREDYCAELTTFDDYFTELTTVGVGGKVNRLDPDGPFLPGGDHIDFAPYPLGSANVLVPREWIVDNLVEAVSKGYVPFYMAFGEMSSSLDDGMSALSSGHRNAGNWVQLPLLGVTDNLIPDSPSYDDDFFSTTFIDMYGSKEDNNGNLPGFVGANHANPEVRGPLKDDWTKSCPVNKPKAWRDEHCFSLQESIYGTVLLKELEAIKQEVDPSGMFTCQYCVGDS